MTPPRPIFLLSLPRSGSTLAQRVLAAHPEVETAAEPWVFLPHAYALRERGIVAEYTHVLAARAVRDFVSAFPNGEDDYYAELRAFVLALYANASHGEPRYFLDKTPRYHFVLPELFRTFPDAKVVFLWRNPLAVVASIVRTWTKGKWNVDRWRGDLRGIGDLVDGYREHASTTLAVRFEDLVSNPEGTWPTVFDYLELEFDPALLEGFADVRLAGRMGDPTGVDRYRELSTEPLGKWKGTLGHPVRKRWCREYLEWIGPERLTVMGYDQAELLDALERLPSTPRMLGSDLVHGGYWAVARHRKEAAYRRMTPRVR